MYKIFCESYINYINSFDTDNYRVRVAKPIELLVDVAKYQEEKRKESKIYQEVSDLLCYLEENIDKYPRVKAFLWTIEARGMKGKKYQIFLEISLLVLKTKRHMVFKREPCAFFL